MSHWLLVGRAGSRRLLGREGQLLRPEGVVCLRHILLVLVHHLVSRRMLHGRLEDVHRLLFHVRIHSARLGVVRFPLVAYDAALNVALEWRTGRAVHVKVEDAFLRLRHELRRR